MSTVTEKKLEEIRARFSRIATDVKMDNVSGLYDKNSHMERFFKQVLNILHGFNLVSTNLKLSNYPAIDLKDTARRIAYQVTSTNTKQKIKETLNTFSEKKMEADFDWLYFLILTDSESGKSLVTVVTDEVKYEIITIYGLGRMISDLDDEAQISEIHEIIMKEYVVEDGGAASVKAPAKYNLTSIQRLIDQAHFDPVKEFKEIEVYGNEVEEFVKKLASLTIEQRTMLYEVVLKCELKPHSHTCIFISSTRIAVEFNKREKLVIDTLIDLGLIWVDEEFSVDYSQRDFTALIITYKSKSDLNIFAELKTFADDDPDVLQAMLISLDFSCLAL
ncbi:MULTISPECIES: SMEK domain-containing protein [Pseudomonas syringae group]|uniref:SMEK domain-containing protein n=6 Tax=Pseudomonas syringae group TaxID=136849 RepID=A0AAD0GLU8_9PSED|nr:MULTISPECIES: SMEK domain-containing protein [Pseudomonas syringae group]AVB18110.1 hypothetical protein BKM03_01570 [Pseudomonas avellanae]KWS61875.1 hypothetical protein AL055_27500 [Pseudomonas amygdali pv. morsprunorum]PHN35411.1 hypothetical protein AO261_01455 [Pseudomonas avellanae]POC86587.1 hypothetical protein BKM26_20440 [Pseudomonas avellanae]POD05228.1 hypothetical protein BKM20_19720 [Pseudomonas avellanae]